MFGYAGSVWKAVLLFESPKLIRKSTLIFHQLDEFLSQLQVKTG